MLDNPKSWPTRIRTRQTIPSATGGYPFAADPELTAVETRVHWIPTATPYVVPIAPAPPEFDTALIANALITGKLPGEISGRYLDLGPPGSDIQLTLLDDRAGAPLALLLPLDTDLPARLEMAAALWRWISSGASISPSDLSPQRRARLINTLRALDGRLAEASTRDIAAALFGADRLPAGREWKSHDLRSRTRRLIDSGVELMQGGYRDLLRTKPRRLQR